MRVVAEEGSCCRGRYRKGETVVAEDTEMDNHLRLKRVYLFCSLLAGLLD